MLGQFHHGFAEDGGVAGGQGFGGVGGHLLHDARLGIEGRHAVPLGAILHGGFVAVALLRLHVQQDGAVLHLFLGVLKGPHRGVHVVAVDGAHVAEAQVLEQQARHHQALEIVLAPFGRLGHALGNAFQRDGLDGHLDAIPPPMVVLARHELVQVALQAAHVGADAHVVVVEDDEEVLGLQIARLVEPFEGHARGHGAIADDGDAMVVLLLKIPRLGHAEHGGNAGGRVARAEMVVGTFLALEKARRAGEGGGTDVCDP